MSSILRLAGHVKESIVDGPGIRFVLFAQGCKHNCKGCHNLQTHSFEGGNLVDIAYILTEIKKNPLLDGVTFSGGEPFEQAEAFALLAEEIKKLGLSIITYTGYTYEYIRGTNTDSWQNLLELSDILIDGRFDINKKDYLLKFKGSENQRVIDVQKSIISNELTLVNW